MEENRSGRSAAAKDCGKAIDTGVKDPNVYRCRGFALVKMGQADKSIPDYDQSVALEPQNPIAYFLRANAYSDFGQCATALPDYIKAITLDGTQIGFYTKLADCYLSQNDGPNALDTYSKAIELSPKNLTLYELRGLAEIKLGSLYRGWRDIAVSNILPTKQFQNEITLSFDAFEKSIDRE